MTCSVNSTPGKLAAVVHLLEVMVHDDEDIEDSDTLSPAEAKAIAKADEWSRHNQPIPHEGVLGELAFPWPTGRR